MITINKDAKRIKKNQAFYIIKSMKESRCIPSDLEIDSLLLFFSENVSKKPKTAEAWVAGVADTRKLLASTPINSPRKNSYYYLWVSEGKAMATNGRFARRCDTELDDGIYDPKTLLKIDCEIEPPQIRIVFKKVVGGDLVQVGDSDIEKVTENQKIFFCIRGFFFPEKLFSESLLGGELLQDGHMLYGSNHFGEWVAAGRECVS